MEEFQIISALKAVETNSPLLEGGRVQWFLVKMVGKGGQLTVEKPDKPSASPVITALVNTDKSCWKYVSLIWCDTNSTLPLWENSSGHEQNIRRIRIRGHSTNTHPAVLYPGKVIKQQGESKELTQPRAAQGHVTKWIIGAYPEWNSGEEKGHSVKFRDNNKLWTLV